MAHTFDDETVTAVLSHMNKDHAEDNVIIARAYSGLDFVAEAKLTRFDGAEGVWAVVTAEGDEHEVTVPWPDGEISERSDVRRQIVSLFHTACARLGIQPPEHN